MILRSLPGQVPTKRTEVADREVGPVNTRPDRPPLRTVPAMPLPAQLASTAMSKKALTILGCGVLALLFVALAVVYFTRSAQDLPAFLPGHQAGLTKHHTKHGIAMLGLAVLAVIGGWMLSGRPDSGTSRP